MNRRGFLGALLGALVLDPEKALWVPGRKLISIPTPQRFSNFQWDSVQYGLSFEEFAARYIHPAMASLANNSDAQSMQRWLKAGAMHRYDVLIGHKIPTQHKAQVIS